MTDDDRKKLARVVALAGVLLIYFAAACIVAFALTGCGGGDPEDEPDGQRVIGQPDCSTGVCK